jgi:hypothetical protein
VCDGLVDQRATALMVLTGSSEQAASIVSAIRGDARVAEVLLGAPAGQPEFAGWAAALGEDNAAIPFLRYLPERLSPLGARVEGALRERLDQAPSFVAFEGYDTVVVLAELLRSGESWPGVAVEGTRGEIRFSRTPGVSVWQWTWPPIQVVDRDPAHPDRFRVLRADARGFPDAPFDVRREGAWHDPSRSDRRVGRGADSRRCCPGRR